jgi:gluconolactonase
LTQVPDLSTQPAVVRTRAVRLVEGCQFTEGPLWDAANDRLIFSDLEANAELIWRPGEGVSILRESSGKANGHDFDLRGRLLTCEGENRRVTRREPNGGYTVLADAHDGQPLNRPNDLITHPSGSVLFTDPNYDLSTGEDRQFVYRIAPDGTLHRAFPQSFNKPNGIGLSPDAKTLYLNLSSDHQVLAAPLDKEGQPTAPPRRLIDGLDRGPDGLTVHRHTGTIFLALFWNNRQRPDEQGINVFTSDGNYRGMIPVPGTTTNCCFDPTADLLYVTSGDGVYAIDLGPDYHGQPVVHDPDAPTRVCR